MTSVARRAVAALVAAVVVCLAFAGAASAVSVAGGAGVSGGGASPHDAVEDDEYSSWYTSEIKHFHLPYPAGYDCEFEFRYHTVGTSIDDMSETADVWLGCAGPKFTGDLPNDPTDVALTGVGRSGGKCSLTLPLVDGTDWNGSAFVDAYQWSWTGEFNTANDPPCQFDHAHFDAPRFGSDPVEDFDISSGPDVPIPNGDPGGGCSDGNHPKEAEALFRDYKLYSGDPWTEKSWESITLAKDRGSDGWAVMYVTRSKSSGGLSYGPSSTSQAERLATDGNYRLSTVVFGWPDPDTWPQGWAFSQQTDTSKNGDTQIVGMEVTWLGNGILYPNKFEGFHSADHSMMLGWTDPALCVWYFGQQLHTGDGAGDTPAGGLGGGGGTDPGGPPPVDPPGEGGQGGGETGCGWSWTDPGNWASAGFCEIASVLYKIYSELGNIWEAVAGLGADIAGIAGSVLGGLGAVISGAVSGTLTDLFVPDGSALEARVSAIRSDWTNSGVGAFFGVFTGALSDVENISSGGDCNGPKWTLNYQSIHQDLQPFAACSGGMATMAAILHGALTVGVYLGAGAAALIILAASFGVHIRLGSFGRSGGEGE